MTAYKYQRQHASNYNYKPKRSFGQKLKNFFRIPEEDLKEEEPTKQFEKIKLFTLNRQWLFLSILVFLSIINLLVGFNVNFLYLRQILGFLFIILVPGLLIMLCFKIRTVKFWEYLVYTVGLSVAFIMFAGLAVNWTLPALGITDKPLSLLPILISFNIFLLTLWFVAVYRNQDFKPFDVTVPKLDTLNNIFFIIPMTFPILAILGAFILNNHGPNILTMIMILDIAVYVLLLVIFRKHLNENVWPWALLTISLALLLSFSMRSWYVSGVDSNTEYMLSRINLNQHYWSPLNPKHSYNFMLSISIFPTIINFFSNLSLTIIYKISFNLIFSLVFIISYMILNKFISKVICFCASFFFISQPMTFNSIFSIQPRQELALIFFGLMLLVLFTKELNPLSKKIFFVIFGASMIVSHYSTAYIALAIFTLTYVFILIYKLYENQKIKKRKIYPSQKSEFYLTGALVLLLFIFGFLWYSQITPIGNGLIDFAGKSVSNLGNIFNQDVQSRGNSPLMQLRLGNEYNFNVYEELNNYINDSLKDTSSQNLTSQVVEGIHLKSSISTNYLISRGFSSKLTDFGQIIFFLGKFLVIFGFFIFNLFLSKRVKINTEFKILINCFFVLFALSVFLPYVTIDYEISRIYEQALLVISIFVCLPFLFIFRKKSISYIFLILFSIMYFFYSGYIFYQLSGNSEVYLNYNNFGTFYDKLYVHNSEVASVNWLQENMKKDSVLRLDNYANLRFLIVKDNLSFKITNLLIPEIIKKGDYIYGDYTNDIYDTTITTYRNRPLFFNFPTKFLNDNKNKIYNDGGSEIFR